MASSFDRWEKDPFFSAAEEVQESADRMQSTYRTWDHARSDAAKQWNLEELRRDLHAALGTTKWQLEVFEKAVRSSYIDDTDNAKDRHQEFIVAIEDQVSRVQRSLHESAKSEGKERPLWVSLDEGESNELALFLSGSLINTDNSLGMDKGLPPEGVENATHSSDKPYGHRRTASANADIDAWKISVPNYHLHQNSSNEYLPVPPRKIPSLAGFLNSMDFSPSQSNWSKNGFRKVKAVDSDHQSDSASLILPQHVRGTNACYERSKTCLENSNDCYDKQLYGWYGALQRQFQRSQYQMRYSRPVQITFSAVLLFLIFVFVLHVI